MNSFTDKNKGSASNAKGTKGTKNDSVWGGNEWSGSNAWEEGEFW